MAQIIYGLTQDNGDGSSSIRWFKNKDDVDKVLEQEEFYANESEPAETLTFPDELDLEECGFSFYEFDD